MGEKTIACKVDDESDLYKQLSEFEERYGNRSQALRAAIEAGIEAERSEDPQLSPRKERLLNVAYNASAGTIVTAVLMLVGVLPIALGGYVGVALVTVSVLALGLAWVDEHGFSSSLPASGEVAD